MSYRWILTPALLIVFLFSVSFAAPSTVEQLSADVLVVRDDAGKCVPGSNGMTHQYGPEYQAKKILDLSDVPEDLWKATSKVRLSAFFSVRDYSWHDPKIKPNGLDEAIEIVVNGRVHRCPTNAGLPVFKERAAMDQCFSWHDFAVPKEELVRGPNEIIFRKAVPKDKTSDDYLYLGIDNTVEGGNSWVKFSDKSDWQQDKLTVPGGKGEYAVRLYLIRGQTDFEAAWLPAEGQTKDDLRIFDYAGSHGDATRVEWDPRRLDMTSPITVGVETGDEKEFTFRWLDENGEAKTPPVKCKGPRGEAALTPPVQFRPSGIQLDKSLPLKRVTLKASRNYHPIPCRVDMVPHIANPTGAPANRAASCRIEKEKAFLANDNLRCEFKTDGKLQLVSLYNEIAAAEMVRSPNDSALFMVEVGDKRYAGSRDFECRSPSGLFLTKGFSATLLCKEIGLEAKISVWMDDALRMGLEITNRSDKPVDFKVAFPHLSGLAISDKPMDDYYFFPQGGGIFSDAPAIIRRGYGDHQALYQLMDIFSPERGGGLSVRCTDEDGRYKVLALRKHIPGENEVDCDKCITPTSDEFKWTNSLPESQGIGLTYEYLRRTRAPGKSFKVKDVAVKAHPGDWHAAMKEYADWCHRVWKFRPFPSRLTPVINMIAAGWGKGFLFKDGAYRTDFIKPMCDCVELMSWWEWSPLGPWSTPFERLHEVMTEAQIKRWDSYFVQDPVTGQKMWNNQPGDYDGYNERFGGLPAFRKAIQTYRDMGLLVTLYTDPFRMDDASKVGREYGKLWGVVKPDGEYSKAYEVWNPCHDAPEVRQWVADTMKRVMRETDADGIRLDEYGHKGWACFSKLHKHTFAEWGCTEWQRAVAETTKMVRRAMDEAKPGSILTTEHPGYDFLMQYMEGCITYDLTVQASPLRPLECNLQRFYFPECKPGELDHRGADKLGRKRFWNAVGSFGRYYPTNMYNILRENGDAFESRDCQPLIPTLAQYVYANRFSSPGKTIYMLYNATGHSFEGPALRADVRDNEHMFDMLNCREVSVENGAMRVFLPREDVLCLAQLPIKVTVAREVNLLEVTVREARGGWQLCVCNRDGEPLLSRTAVNGANKFNLIEIAQEDAMPACVKLLDGRILVDAAAVPPGK